MEIDVARDTRAAALALDAGLGRPFELIACVEDAAKRAALSRAVGDVTGMIDRVPVPAMERLHPRLAGRVRSQPERAHPRPGRPAAPHALQPAAAPG